MKKTLYKFFLIFLVLFQFETIAEEKNYYKELITDWSRIFPDQNRNAAGPKFFKYLIDQDLSFEDFIEFNKRYCPVSGSLIAPGSEPAFISMNEVDSDNKRFCVRGRNLHFIIFLGVATMNNSDENEFYLGV